MSTTTRTAAAMPMASLALVAIAAIAVGAFISPERAQAQPSEHPLYLMRHVSSGLCVIPIVRDVQRNNTPTQLGSDINGDGRCDGRDPHAYFERLPSGSMRHLQSGKCLHPRGSFANSFAQTVVDNTPLVLHDGCNERRLGYYLRQGSMQHQTSGLCFHPGGGRAFDGVSVVLHRGCRSHGARTNFELVEVDSKRAAAALAGPIVANHSAPFVLRHTATGTCFMPEDGKGQRNNVGLVLQQCLGPDRSPIAYYRHLSNGAVQHVDSGKCIHPRGGRAHPGNNTPLVLHDGCQGGRLAFDKHIVQDKNDGHLQHRPSRKCVHPRGGTARIGVRLVLHDGCDERRLHFRFASN